MLTLTSASRIASGTVVYAGWLPDGTSLSGSSVLIRRDGVVWLPIFKRVGGGVLSGMIKINPSATTPKKVTDGDDTVFLWAAAAKASHGDIHLRASGGYFDARRSLAAYCSEKFRSTTLPVTAEESASDSFGLSLPLTDAAATFRDRAMKGAGISLYYNASLGVFNGTFDCRLKTPRFQRGSGGW